VFRLSKTRSIVISDVAFSLFSYCWRTLPHAHPCSCASRTRLGRFARGRLRVALVAGSARSRLSPSTPLARLFLSPLPPHLVSRPRARCPSTARIAATTIPPCSSLCVSSPLSLRFLCFRIAFRIAFARLSFFVLADVVVTGGGPPAPTASVHAFNGTSIPTRNPDHERVLLFEILMGCESRGRTLEFGSTMT